MSRCCVTGWRGWRPPRRNRPAPDHPLGDAAGYAARHPGRVVGLVDVERRTKAFLDVGAPQEIAPEAALPHDLGHPRVAESRVLVGTEALRGEGVVAQIVLVGRDRLPYEQDSDAARGGDGLDHALVLDEPVNHSLEVDPCGIAPWRNLTAFLACVRPQDGSRWTASACRALRH